MNHGRPAPTNAPPPSLEPIEGWHCLHVFYQFDRGALMRLSTGQLSDAVTTFQRVLDRDHEDRPQRLQISIVSGHKADFSLMMMDPDPLRMDRITQSLLSSSLGPALIPTYSFVSMSEISEYLPTVEQFRERLIREGLEPGSEMLEARIASYREREPGMRKHRLFPDFPDWPATCFYPMNKKREDRDNWFALPKSRRSAMMSEHGRSGMQYSGRVTQLVTTSVGLDDWEWGVTLWASNPQYLKDIVYQMRFDEASARYAEFGPFYTSYVSTATEMLTHCRITQ